MHRRCMQSAWLRALSTVGLILGAAPLQAAPGSAPLDEGVAALRAGQLRDAERAFIEATEASPSDPEPFYYLGLVYAREGRHEKAITAFRDTLERAPEFPGAATLLGIAHYRKGEAEEAQPVFERALLLDPEDSSASFFLGLIHQEQGRCEEAIPHFEHSRRDPDLEQVAYFNLGVCHRKSGRDDQARRAFQQAVESNPRSSVAQDARDLLEAYPRSRMPRTDKPWSIAGSVGLSYDDNVTQDELDVDSGSGDVAGVFEFSPSYRVLRLERSELEIGYDLFQSLHVEEDEFDLQTHSLYFDGLHEYRSVDLGLGYRWSDSTLGGDDFLAIHSVRPSAGYALLPQWYARASYEFQDRDFDDSRRDAAAHGFSFENYYLLDDGRGHFRLGYRVVGEDAKGSEFDHTSHVVFAGFRADTQFLRLASPLLQELEVGLSYEFALRDYDHSTPSIGEERLDKRHGVRFELARQLTEVLAVHLDYTFTISDSNLSSADYHQNVVTLRLGAEF
jgi:tetratricopeptide (TPR) repeat protein